MARIKKKEHENLSPENIKKVISLLEPETGVPITKKEACQILNIAYNTTRLGKIIDEYREREAYLTKMRDANRGKPATPIEIEQVIAGYLHGESVAEIASSLFRSSGFVKGIIERIGTPQRPRNKEARGRISLLPEACVAETFSVGEIVWSAKYHTTAVIREELSLERQKTFKGIPHPVDYEARYGSKCYRIGVIQSVDSSDSFFPFITAGGFDAYALAYDLGKLTHLTEYGVDLNKL